VKIISVLVLLTDVILTPRINSSTSYFF